MEAKMEVGSDHCKRTLQKETDDFASHGEESCLKRKQQAASGEYNQYEQE